MAADPQERRGRRPAASREQVLDATLSHFLRGDRIDIRAIATELGLARGTVYRWFGSREELIGRVVVLAAVPALDHARATATGTGGPALLETLDHFNHILAGAPALHRFVDNERTTALGIICTSTAIVTPALARHIAGMIEAEVTAGAYASPLEPYVLAHAIVKVGQAFLFNHGQASMIGAGDIAQLREVQAALLGVRDAG
jgi:AcrR family transcriptional regulator